MFVFCVNGFHPSFFHSLVNTSRLKFNEDEVTEIWFFWAAPFTSAVNSAIGDELICGAEKMIALALIMLKEHQKASVIQNHLYLLRKFMLGTDRPAGLR